MDKTIITAFLIIAGMLSVIMLFNAIYPAVAQSSDAMLGMERRLDERFKSQIEIVHAVPDGDVTKTALVWVKNVGSTTIQGLDRCDVFFGPEGDYAIVPYDTGIAKWTYSVENDTSWKPTATVKLSIDSADFLVDGERYFIKMVLANGITAEYFFTK